ncbi:MAG: ABC transporter ATP-binding protein/permease [Firmicutes bacterium]|nr:ABC transporter ATP-binding protein/permease [Bacillota bacterium]
MNEYLPLLIVGAILGVVSAALILAFALIKDKKESMGFERNIKDRELFGMLLRYAKPFRKNFVLVGIVMLFSISYDIVSPLLISDLEGVIKDEFEMMDVIWRVAVYASILVVSLASSYVQAIVLQKTGQRIVSKLREDVFAHIESLSHAQLAQIPVGKLVTRTANTANDTNAISMMFTNILVNLVKNCFVILGILVAMLCVNYMLTLMVLCFVPFIVLFTVIFRKFSRRAYRQVKNSTTDINTFLSENLSGMKVIQVFNKEQRKIEEFDEKNEKLYQAQRGQVFVFSIFRPLVYMLYISSVLCLFFIGSKGYLDGLEILGQVIDSATVVAFYMFISKFFSPIQSLAEQFHRLQSAFASAEKIFTVMNLQPTVVDESDAIELEEVRGEIEFKHVWFAYNEDEWVLKDVSFRVNAKETVAFVGSTGSGKTTILSLLCRNYDIQRGEILLDGIDIRHIKISSLRKHFGQMLQDVFLFSGTIRSNIVLLDEFDDEQVMEACRYVNADKFIEKQSKGLDEEVRERGNNFSAGQRQLLSFARTIIHRPEVMILDEATANIDTETEILIQDSLHKIMSVGTMLIVAHRLSTIQHADRILVISNGEIIEQGNHRELLAKKGRYYELYNLQYSKEQLKAQ